MRMIREWKISPAVGNRSECLYVVASDETVWNGIWENGQFSWIQLASLPQENADDMAQ